MSIFHPGYIGGDILYAVHKAHPDYEYTLLVRNEDRAKVVKEKYPNVKFVYGNLDASDVIEKAAAEADIVIREFSFSRPRFGVFFFWKREKRGKRKKTLRII